MRCIALCSTIVLILAAPAVAAHHSPIAVTKARGAVAWQRQVAWHNQDRAWEARTPTAYSERHVVSLAYLHWDISYWKRIRLHAQRDAGRFYRLIPHLSLWLCIHSGEGDWHNADTGGNGHYGGLQMTSPWGKGVYYVYRADWLSPFEQMRKAELGYAASGHSYSWLFGQWAHPECMGLR